jgi:hypothetical protein
MYMLRAVREVQEQFGRRRDCVFTYFQKNLADRSSERRAPRFSRHHAGAAGFSKIALQGVDLGALAGTVPTLERNQANHQ